MPKKTIPKRYFNIRIDEDTYKALYRIKGKNEKIIDLVRSLVLK